MDSHYLEPGIPEPGHQDRLVEEFLAQNLDHLELLGSLLPEKVYNQGHLVDSLAEDMPSLQEERQQDSQEQLAQMVLVLLDTELQGKRFLVEPEDTHLEPVQAAVVRDLGRVAEPLKCK